jgi:hypothetical protein
LGIAGGNERGSDNERAGGYLFSMDDLRAGHMAWDEKIGVEPSDFPEYGFDEITRFRFPEFF